MDPIVLILIVLLIFAVFGGYYGNRPYIGNGLGLVLLILLILFLTGKIQL